MSTYPVGYNPSLIPISGTSQIGNLAIGESDFEWSSQPNDVRFWMSPQDAMGYIVAHQTPSGDQPNPLGVPAYVGFWRSKFKTDESFINLSEYVSKKHGTPQTFSTASQAKTWLNDNGYWTSYTEGPTPTPTPSITPTQTITPSITPTQTITPSITPTNTPTVTPTPSTTPIPVTGYSFNLVALPYNFPSSGSSIMNNTGGVTTGSTEINVLATGGRGFYFNSIDSDGINRTNYYSSFTGQNVTITFTQSGNTAIYSGDTNSFKYWFSSPNSGFVFGANIGVPPTNIPSGTAALLQSASTQYTIGVPVYVSLVTS